MTFPNDARCGSVSMMRSVGREIPALSATCVADSPSATLQDRIDGPIEVMSRAERG